MDLVEKYLGEAKNIAVEKGTNQVGKTYILVQLADPKIWNKETMDYTPIKEKRYAIYTINHNYKHGSIMKSMVLDNSFKKMSYEETQKYSREGLPYDEAKKIYDKRLKGKKQK